MRSAEARRDEDRDGHRRRIDGYPAREDGEHDALVSHESFSSPLYANAPAYSCHTAGASKVSRKSGSPPEPPKRFSTLISTEVLKKSTSTFTVSVARPYAAFFVTS